MVVGWLTLRRGVWLVIAAGFLVVGCTAAVGAGIGVGLIGVAALTSGCYDPVEANVLDGVTGDRACDATVVAVSQKGSEVRFSSCFHADLSQGLWKVRATRRGYEPATTNVTVAKARGKQGDSCEPAVQTLDLSLYPIGVLHESSLPVRPLASGEAPLGPHSLSPPGSLGGTPAAPTAPSTPPAPAPAPPPANAPPPTASPVTPAAPAPAPPSSAAPAPSAAPPQ